MRGLYIYIFIYVWCDTIMWEKLSHTHKSWTLAGIMVGWMDQMKSWTWTENIFSVELLLCVCTTCIFCWCWMLWWNENTFSSTSEKWQVGGGAGRQECNSFSPCSLLLTTGERSPYDDDSDFMRVRRQRKFVLSELSGFKTRLVPCKWSTAQVKYTYMHDKRMRQSKIYFHFTVFADRRSLPLVIYSYFAERERENFCTFINSRLQQHY